MAVKRTLEEVIKITSASNKIIVHSNKKNAQTRRRLGITVQDQKEMIRNLKKNDCTAGPEKNYNPIRKEEIWKFKVNAFGETMYIKIYITDPPDDDINVISVHIDNIA